MPVGTNGRWESWESRIARDKPEAVEAVAEAVAEEAVVEAPKRKRTRRGKAAAEAAIAAATGAAVEIDGTPDEETETE